MSVSQKKAVRQQDLFLLDRDNVFARTLSFYMDMNYINNNDLSEFLEMPIGKVIDMRMGVVFGTIKIKDTYKLDKIFEQPSGTFLSLLKRTIAVDK